VDGKAKAASLEDHKHLQRCRSGLTSFTLLSAAFSADHVPGLPTKVAYKSNQVSDAKLRSRE